VIGSVLHAGPRINSNCPTGSQENITLPGGTLETVILSVLNVILGGTRDLRMTITSILRQDGGQEPSKLLKNSEG